MIELATVFVGICLAQISPGPNMVAVASASMGSGRASGLATSLGIATGVFVWSILFALGVAAILDAFPQTLIAMRFIGGGYLLWLAAKALIGATKPDASGPDVAEHAARRDLKASYRRGLLVVMTNPKAALMWIAISMFLGSSHLPHAYYVLIGVMASMSAAAIYGTYALLFSTGVALRAYRRFFRAIEAAFGAAFGALGVSLVADGIKSLRT